MGSHYMVQYYLMEFFSGASLMVLLICSAVDIRRSGAGWSRCLKLSGATVLVGFRVFLMLIFDPYWGFMGAGAGLEPGWVQTWLGINELATIAALTLYGAGELLRVLGCPSRKPHPRVGSSN